MIRRTLARLAVLRADDRHATVWCGACGWWVPVGHGCQGGNR
jgi:hypothetical protein